MRRTESSNRPSPSVTEALNMIEKHSGDFNTRNLVGLHNGGDFGSRRSFFDKINPTNIPLVQHPIRSYNNFNSHLTQSIINTPREVYNNFRHPVRRLTAPDQQMTFPWGGSAAGLRTAMTHAAMPSKYQVMMAPGAQGFNIRDAFISDKIMKLPFFKRPPKELPKERLAEAMPYHGAVGGVRSGQADATALVKRLTGHLSEQRHQEVKDYFPQKSLQERMMEISNETPEQAELRQEQLRRDNPMTPGEHPHYSHFIGPTAPYTKGGGVEGQMPSTGTEHTGGAPRYPVNSEQWHFLDKRKMFNERPEPDPTQEELMGELGDAAASLSQIPAGRTRDFIMHFLPPSEQRLSFDRSLPPDLSKGIHHAMEYGYFPDMGPRRSYGDFGQTFRIGLKTNITERDLKLRAGMTDEQIQRAKDITNNAPGPPDLSHLNPNERRGFDRLTREFNFSPEEAEKAVRDMPNVNWDRFDPNKPHSDYMNTTITTASRNTPTFFDKRQTPHEMFDSFSAPVGINELLATTRNKHLLSQDTAYPAASGRGFQGSKWKIEDIARSHPDLLLKLLKEFVKRSRN